MLDAEIATGRKSLDGPTNINLRSPEMAKASRPLNRYLRFEAPVEHKLKEIVILLTARFWGGQYVWYSHRTYAIEAGRWASVMPARLAETLGLTETIRAIPIVEPEAVHTIGLVVPAREPMTPLNAALVSEARRLASTLIDG